MMKITKEQIKRVYSGRPGACTCGCAGKYYEATDAKSTKMIEKVLKLINEPPAMSIPDSDVVYEAIQVGTRLYIAYKE